MKRLQSPFGFKIGTTYAILSMDKGDEIQEASSMTAQEALNRAAHLNETEQGREHVAVKVTVERIP